MVIAREPVVVIGSGHAGIQVASSLRENGYDGPVVVIGDEDRLPYHRPPLSKTFVTAADAELQPLCSPNFWTAHAIELRTGAMATEIDPHRRRVHLASGAAIPFGHLVLATGSRHGKLTVPGAELDGVLTLRTAEEAIELRHRLAGAEHVAVVGGGFIGMEFAAAAGLSGADVTQFISGARAMPRATTPAVAHYLQESQRRRGVRVKVGTSVSAIHGTAKHGVTGVLTADGNRYPADLVVVGVGAQPNTELAATAGLAVSYNGYHGVVVDEHLTTSHPQISAVGDCARFPNENGYVRLESVQNAVDQARFVAERLVHGRSHPYKRVPWFWSDQGGVKLQIAGLTAEADRTVVRGNRGDGKFSVFGFSDGRLVSVESINKPGDHMASRRILGSDRTLTEAQAADTTFSLKLSVTRAHGVGVERRPRLTSPPSTRSEGQP